MTKKSWITRESSGTSSSSTAGSSSGLVASTSNTLQDSVPSLQKNATSLPTRTTSGKLLVPPSRPDERAVVGKFSEAKPQESSESEAIEEPAPLGKMNNKSRALLLRAESNGSLRRGTPRPTDLKKTLSTVKFVLEESGLDQVAEEDFEMA